MAKRLRRSRPNAGSRESRTRGLNVLSIPYHGTLRAYTRRAAYGSQSSFSIKRSSPGDGYSGIRPRSGATIGKILSHNGYATGWWGKNHNTPDSHTSPAGPFTNWPTGLGFDYFYGFMGGETDQFYPALFRNTLPVEAPTSPEKGYHLTTDLADDCITWMLTQKSIAPDRPF